MADRGSADVLVPSANNPLVEAGILPRGDFATSRGLHNERCPSGFKRCGSGRTRRIHFSTGDLTRTTSADEALDGFASANNLVDQSRQAEQGSQAAKQRRGILKKSASELSFDSRLLQPPSEWSVQCAKQSSSQSIPPPPANPETPSLSTRRGRKVEPLGLKSCLTEMPSSLCGHVAAVAGEQGDVEPANPCAGRLKKCLSEKSLMDGQDHEHPVPEAWARRLERRRRAATQWCPLVKQASLSSPSGLLTSPVDYSPNWRAAGRGRGLMPSERDLDPQAWIAKTLSTSATPRDKAHQSIFSPK